MENISRSFYILAVVFLLIGLYTNFLSNGNFPKLPGDVFINKENIKVYIPLTSSLVISILLSILFKILNQ